MRGYLSAETHETKLSHWLLKSDSMNYDFTEQIMDKLPLTENQIKNKDKLRMRTVYDSKGKKINIILLIKRLQTPSFNFQIKFKIKDGEVKIKLIRNLIDKK